MIHQPLGYTGLAQASDIEIDAKHINQLKKDLYEIISQQTGQPYNKVYQDDVDKWTKLLEDYLLLPNTEENRNEMMNKLAPYFHTIQMIYSDDEAV